VDQLQSFAAFLRSNMDASLVGSQGSVFQVLVDFLNGITSHTGLYLRRFHRVASLNLVNLFIAPLDLHVAK